MKWKTVARVLFSMSAAVAIALLVRHVGGRTFLALLRTALPWLPILLVLEAVRIAADVVALRQLCGEDATRIPLSKWIRVHLIANSALILPGGRAVSEAMKFAQLGPVLGSGRVIARLTLLYVTTLLATALICSAAAIAALLVNGASKLAPAIAVHATICVISASLIRAALHRATLPKSIARWFGASDEAMDEMRTTSRELPILSRTALAAKLTNRATQVVQFGILLYVLGAPSSPARAFLANGVSLLGGALAELSPAQLGGTDGALAFSSHSLSIGLGVAVALATLMRVVQLAWSAVGGALSLLPAR